MLCPNWFQQMGERLKTDAKARKIAAAIVGAFIFKIMITVYITTPKMSDVAKLKEQGNAPELCVLIEKNGQYDRHVDVMEAAAQAHGQRLTGDIEGAIEQNASRVLSQLENNHNGKQVRIQMLKDSNSQEINRL